MENQEQRWLDVKRASLYLNVSVHFIRSLLWDGAVPYIPAGRKFVIDRLDLDKWATRNKQSNPA